MGQLEAFEKGKNGVGLGLKGKTPSKRAGALGTSQLHAQLDGTGPEYKGHPGDPKEPRTIGGQSVYDLDGKTPAKYEKPADTSGNF